LEHGVKSVKRAVEEGSTLSEALQSLGFFTPLFVEIVASGEEVGRTEEMLAWLAEGLEKDLEQDLQTYAALLEPIMLLAVGVVVGVIVIATASPMLNLIQTLG
jgi:type II secretory pathway component PulF